MTNKVIILGATGRFGRAATEAFLQHGWKVSVLIRSSNMPKDDERLNYVDGDVYQRHSLSKAVKGHDLIVNALNPPYTDWEDYMPDLTKNVIEAALAASATVMIPGNVYNYGTQMPNVIDETSPQIATTKKGRIRIRMERAYNLAANKGLQTIILRGGDFIEERKTGNWFDSYIMNRIEEGIITYPGPLDQCHAWAYLPDMAKAMALLADKRSQFSSFEEFGFEGFSITGQELINHAQIALNRKVKIKKMPWVAMKIASLFTPMVKEVLEMRYLWDTPHSIDGTKLAVTLPNFKQTDLNHAFNELFSNKKNS